MFDRIKNLKIVKKIQQAVNPQLRWQEFANKTQLDKSTTAYLEAISGVEDLNNMFSDASELEAVVRAQLQEEFPGIENKKSYELLVDAVVHNIMKKQLQATDSLDIE